MIILDKSGAWLQCEQKLIEIQKINILVVNSKIQALQSTYKDHNYI